MRSAWTSHVCATILLLICLCCLWLIIVACFFHSPYGWTWCHDGSILRAYTHLAEEIHALESEVDFADRCCYVYAPSELHCTVATLSSFKEPTSFFSTLNSSATNDSRSPEVLLALRRGIMMLWRDGKSV